MFTFLNLDAIAIAKNKFEAIQAWITGTVQFQFPQVLTDAATINWKYDNGYNAQVTLTASRTLNITDIKPGAYGTLRIIQGGSGSYTLTLPTTYTNKVANAGAGALTLSTAVASIDLASFYYDGTNLYWTLSTDFT